MSHSIVAAFIQRRHFVQRLAIKWPFVYLSRRLPTRQSSSKRFKLTYVYYHREKTEYPHLK